MRPQQKRGDDPMRCEKKNAAAGAHVCTTCTCHVYILYLCQTLSDYILYDCDDCDLFSLSYHYHVWTVSRPRHSCEHFSAGKLNVKRPKL